MRSRKAVRRALLSVALLGCAACSSAVAEPITPAAGSAPIQPFAGPAPSPSTHASLGRTLSPELAAIAGVGVLTLTDHEVWKRATFAGGPGANQLADVVRPLGTPSALLPPLAAGYLAGRVLDRPGLSAASLRIAGSVVFAGATSAALKTVVGRSRPFQVLNGDADEARLFSGKSSFPSGHTTFAFAAATALDRETSSRWVPWVAYPVGALVGWSRIHDEKHWMSDVAAGAAVGYFAANHAENFLRSKPGLIRKLSLGVDPGRGVSLGTRLDF